MKILALDQSSKISGWAIFDNGKLAEFGKWSFNDDNVGIRLMKLRSACRELIRSRGIEQVVMEDIQLQDNVQLFKTLAEVFGVIYELVTELKLPITAVLASSWKSTLGIKGKQRAEQKRNAQAYIVATYGIKPTQDECDAICIGEHFLKNQGFSWD